MKEEPTTEYAVKHRGVTLMFHVHDPQDVIQRCHVRGNFYESEELEHLRLLTPPGATVLDVGANVGNHAAYFAAIVRARSVFVFDASPAAAAILKKNVSVNGLRSVNTDFLGLAVGASEGFAELLPNPQDHNLGATTFRAVGKSSGYKMITLDSLSSELGNVDLIKVDVEGMELDVIEGCKGIIKRCRPALFVEVRRRDVDRFLGLMNALNYRIERTFQRYLGVFNFVCLFGR